MSFLLERSMNDERKEASLRNDKYPHSTSAAGLGFQYLCHRAMRIVWYASYRCGTFTRVGKPFWLQKRSSRFSFGLFAPREHLARWVRSHLHARQTDRATPEMERDPSSETIRWHVGASGVMREAAHVGFLQTIGHGVNQQIRLFHVEDRIKFRGRRKHEHEQRTSHQD